MLSIKIAEDLSRKGGEKWGEASSNTPVRHLPRPGLNPQKAALRGETSSPDFIFDN